MDNRLIWICISIIHMDFMWTFVFSIRAHGGNCVISAYVWRQFGLMYISVTCGCCMRLLINQWNYLVKWCIMSIWCDKIPTRIVRSTNWIDPQILRSKIKFSNHQYRIWLMNCPKIFTTQLVTCKTLGHILKVSVLHLCPLLEWYINNFSVLYCQYPLLSERYLRA